MRNPITEIRWFVKRVAHIASWIPLLWKDYDWDYAYLYAILERKIYRMQQAINNGYSVQHKHLKRDIIAMLALLKRLQTPDESYHDPVFKDHEAKWGEIVWLDGEMTKFGRSFTLKRANVHTKEDDVQETKECRRLYKKVEQLKKQDREKLFSLLAKRIESMWD